MSEGQIVVGIGLTSESGYVLEKVVRQTDDPNRVLAVHVLEQRPVVLDDYSAISVATDVVACAEVALFERLRRLCLRFGVKNFQILRGHPATELHRVAAQHAAQLLVVGTHGRQGWRVLLGETANAVLKGTQINVLAIHTPDELPPLAPEYKKILVAVDLSTEAAAVLAMAGRLQQRFQVPLTILNVFNPISLVYDGVALSNAIDAQRFNQQVHRQVEVGLCGLIEVSGLVNVHSLVRCGQPSREIRAAACEIGADLIVLGTHGTSGPALLLGSTSNAVLHGVKQDVLAVRVGE